MNFPQNASKQNRVLVYQYVGHFVEKKSFCFNIYPLLLVLSKTLV